MALDDGAGPQYISGLGDYVTGTQPMQPTGAGMTPREIQILAGQEPEGPSSLLEDLAGSPLSLLNGAPWRGRGRGRVGFALDTVLEQLGYAEDLDTDKPLDLGRAPKNETDAMALRMQEQYGGRPVLRTDEQLEQRIGASMLQLQAARGDNLLDNADPVEALGDKVLLSNAREIATKGLAGGADPKAIGWARDYLADFARSQQKAMLTAEGELAATAVGPEDYMKRVHELQRKGFSDTAIASLMQNAGWKSELITDGALRRLDDEVEILAMSGEIERAASLRHAKKTMLAQGLGDVDANVRPGDVLLDQMTKKQAEGMDSFDAFRFGTTNAFFSSVRALHRLAGTLPPGSTDRDILERTASAAIEAHPVAGRAGEFLGGIVDPVFLAVDVALGGIPLGKGVRAVHEAALIRRGVAPAIAKREAAALTSETFARTAAANYFVRRMGVSRATAEVMGNLTWNAVSGAISGAGTAALEVAPEDMSPLEKAVAVAQGTGYGALGGMAFAGIFSGVGKIAERSKVQVRRILNKAHPNLPGFVSDAFENGMAYAEKGLNGPEIEAELTKALDVLGNSRKAMGRNLNPEEIRAVLDDSGLDLDRLATLEVETPDVVRAQIQALEAQMRDPNMPREARGAVAKQWERAQRVLAEMGEPEITRSRQDTARVEAQIRQELRDAIPDEAVLQRVKELDLKARETGGLKGSDLEEYKTLLGDIYSRDLSVDFKLRTAQDLKTVTGWKARKWEGAKAALARAAERKAKAKSPPKGVRGVDAKPEKPVLSRADVLERTAKSFGYKPDEMDVIGQVIDARAKAAVKAGQFDSVEEFYGATFADVKAGGRPGEDALLQSQPATLVSVEDIMDTIPERQADKFAIRNALESTKGRFVRTRVSLEDFADLPRENIEAARIREYADKEGDAPPVVTTAAPGGKLQLRDGRHRLLAAALRGKESGADVTLEAFVPEEWARARGQAPGEAPSLEPLTRGPGTVRVDDPRLKPNLRGKVDEAGVERWMDADPETWPPIAGRFNPDGSITITDGNHRLEAAKRLGLETIPRIFAGEPTAPKVLFQEQPAGDIDKLGFFYRTARVAAAKLKGPQPGKTALAMLRNAGVSPEELRWTGLEAWLEDPATGKVTAAEVQARLNQEHQATLSERVYQDSVGNVTDVPTVATALGVYDRATKDFENHVQEVVLAGMRAKDALQETQVPPDDRFRHVDVDRARRFARTLSVMLDDEEVVNMGRPGRLERIRSRIYERTHELSVDITPATLGDAAKFLPENHAEQLRKIEDLAETLVQSRRVYNEARAAARREGLANRTTYSSYTLAAGDNYREILLTVPVPPDRWRIVKNRASGWDILSDEGGYVGPFSTQQTAEFQAEMANQRRAPGRGGFASGHWDLKNIVTHIRTKDRVLPDGTKMLFIEEIQSDWHQQGRERGYRPQTQDREYSDLRARLDLVANQILSAINRNAPGINQDAPYLLRDLDVVRSNASRTDGTDHTQYLLGSSVRQLAKQYHAGSPGKTVEQHAAWIESELIPLLREKSDLAEQAKVAAGKRDLPPEGPWSKNWHEMAYRRALRRAVEGGYDAIGWTTGRTQSERYRLSQYFDTIEWAVTIKDGQPVYSMNALPVDRGGQAIFREGLDAAALREHLGEGLAARIEAQVSEHRFQMPDQAYIEGTLEGANLNVDDTGMSGFYDQILPRYAAKQGKAWGLTVERGRIETGRSTGNRPVANQFRAMLDAYDSGAGEMTFSNLLSEARNLANDSNDAVFSVAVDKVLDDYEANIRGDREFGGRGDSMDAGDRMIEELRKILTLQAGDTDIHMVRLNQAAKDAVLNEGLPLFQRKGGGGERITAAVEFLEDGRAVIRALEKPDITSFLHEIGHVFRRQLEGEDLRIVQEWAGVKDNLWDRPAEEKFARAWERYLRDGNAPIPALKRAFELLKTWFTSIYHGVRGTPINQRISPELRDVFDRLLGKEAPTKPAAPGAAPSPTPPAKPKGPRRKPGAPFVDLSAIPEPRLRAGPMIVTDAGELERNGYTRFIAYPAASAADIEGQVGRMNAQGIDAVIEGPAVDNQYRGVWIRDTPPAAPPAAAAAPIPPSTASPAPYDTEVGKKPTPAPQGGEVAAAPAPPPAKPARKPRTPKGPTTPPPASGEPGATTPPPSEPNPGVSFKPAGPLEPNTPNIPKNQAPPPRPATGSGGSTPRPPPPPPPPPHRPRSPTPIARPRADAGPPSPRRRLPARSRGRSPRLCSRARRPVSGSGTP